MRQGYAEDSISGAPLLLLHHAKARLDAGVLEERVPRLHWVLSAKPVAHIRKPARHTKLRWREQ